MQLNSKRWKIECGERTLELHQTNRELRETQAQLLSRRQRWPLSVTWQRA